LPLRGDPDDQDADGCLEKHRVPAPPLNPNTLRNRWAGSTGSNRRTACVRYRMRRKVGLGGAAWGDAPLRSGAVDLALGAFRSLKSREGLCKIVSRLPPEAVESMACESEIQSRKVSNERRAEGWSSKQFLRLRLPNSYAVRAFTMRFSRCFFFHPRPNLWAADSAQEQDHWRGERLLVIARTLSTRPPGIRRAQAEAPAHGTSLLEKSTSRTAGWMTGETQAVPLRRMAASAAGLRAACGRR